MKKPSNDQDTAPDKCALLSGTVHIRIDNYELAEISISNNHLKVTLKDAETVKGLSEKIHGTLKMIKIIRELSYSMTRKGIKVEIYDSDNMILSMGAGVHSLLGNFEIKPTRIRKYL
ncbi:hypothetical protein [Thermoplasma acidophilum]|uniref:Uncharacterized protein n=1 Tax=Thermoplasma acidophilum (strain ATCC 25905 / DSM 1728 / JCM 9062 / NBRC 15155 / AMRC-C165) TaxID=273075 RepID=Q9HKW1_THEAC|nr:hypothetical protein [Thermoplasma acidophilum]CAC11624.1 hypothetical protein [Thermoplasma acidophilum]